MKQILKWTALHGSRRRFLGGAAGATFATFAGASIGRAPVASAAACTGPNGSGACSSGNCSGHTCKVGPGITCSNVTGYCGSSACWSSGGKTCCDCSCNVTAGGTHFYCYCYG